MDQLKLVTSNDHKLKEYQRFGVKNITIERGRDIDEVDSDELTVVLYKALDAGKQRVVEDSSLTVEGADIGVNIRWMVDQLDTLAGRVAIWKVYLGYNDGESIHIYADEVRGVLIQTDKRDGFGFDNFFQPEGLDITLHELELLGKKDEYSARKKALTNFNVGRAIASYKISEVPKWDGKYQQQ